MHYNNFLFSEAFICDAFKKLQRDTREHNETFDNICSWYQEYKDDWLLYEDIALVTLGFEKEEILAIGDNENDLGMFRAAGMAAAMGNASESVRRAADLVTDTNEQEGAARVIESIL